MNEKSPQPHKMITRAVLYWFLPRSENERDFRAADSENYLDRLRATKSREGYTKKKPKENPFEFFCKCHCDPGGCLWWKRKLYSWCVLPRLSHKISYILFTSFIKWHMFAVSLP